MLINREIQSVMDVTKDIRSLTDFKRNTGELVKQIRETGHPLVLTVNGKAELVVQDAAGYQQLLDLLDRAEAVAGIQRGLEEMERGEGTPASEVFAAIRRRNNLPPAA
jgi:prevent-host-death family protein